MRYIQTSLAVVIFLFCAPAFADNTDNTNDSFQEVVAKYLAANPKPGLPEEARKFKVQAEFAVQEKQFAKAVELYGKALETAPWWPEGHFNRALILGETKKYWDAMREMKRYLLLAPDASNARAAQDKIYQWEGIAGPEQEIGKVFKDCPDCPEMVILPNLPKPFAMGKYEVTQGQWKAVMGNNPSKFSNCGDTCPVEQVSWGDIQTFIQKLNAKTGKQYRLPTEDEWEYACRAGENQRYCGSDDVDAVGWVGSKFFGNTHPAGQKQANGFDLYDMIGNVWEYCANRVVRGGAFNIDPMFANASYGSKDGGGFVDRYIGFRLLRTLP